MKIWHVVFNNPPDAPTRQDICHVLTADYPYARRVERVVGNKIVVYHETSINDPAGIQIFQFSYDPEEAV